MNKALAVISLGLLSAACAHSSLDQKAPPDAQVTKPPPDVQVTKPAARPAVLSQVVLLSPETLAYANFEEDALLAWTKQFVDKLPAAFARESAPRTVVVSVVMRPGAEPRIGVSASPAYSPEERQRLSAELGNCHPPAARFMEYGLAFELQLNGGTNAGQRELSPPVVVPVEAQRDALKAATTAERLDLLRTWARKEVLPLLGTVASRVDPKFKGVRSVGHLLVALEPSGPLDVPALTDRNPDFWRAEIEMGAGDQLILASQVFLQVANGHLDVARRQANLLMRFAAQGNAAHFFLGELLERLQIFQADVDRELDRGIALNDAGRYDEAIEVFEQLKRDYPYSSHAHYEAFFSARCKAMGADQRSVTSDDWPAVRKTIYALDPLYATDVLATGARDVYLLTRRLQQRALFKEPGTFADDLREFAEIAMELGEFGTAAQFFWVSLATSEDEAGVRKRLGRFLYCLEKLGVTGLKQNFTMDHAAVFQQIEKELRERPGPAKAQVGR